MLNFIAMLFVWAAFLILVKKNQDQSFIINDLKNQLRDYKNTYYKLLISHEKDRLILEQKYDKKIITDIMTHLSKRIKICKIYIDKE